MKNEPFRHPVSGSYRGNGTKPQGPAPSKMSPNSEEGRGTVFLEVASGPQGSQCREAEAQETLQEGSVSELCGTNGVPDVCLETGG